MDYPKRIPNVGLVGGKFVDENVSTGLPGSLIPSAWGNAVTDELLAVIKAAGLTPSEDNNAQLVQAIKELADNDEKSGVVPGDYRKVSVDELGRVTAGSNPTTLAGYGITDAYTQAQVNNLLTGKADKATTLGGYGITDVYTQAQVNNLLTGKAAKATTLVGYGITDAYTQAQVNNLLIGKAAQASTLSGYGITDAYTQTQVNNLLAGKAAQATTLGGYGITDAYTQTQVNNLLAGKATKATTLAGYGITDALSALSIASHGDVNGGVRDDVLISPLKLLNGFAISKAPNGYVKLPAWMGGLVLQWGNIAPVPAAGTTVTFPVSFPNTVLGVFPSIITAAPDDYEIMVSNVSPQNFVLRSYAAQIPNAYWFAIGY
ncbi:hypothetical protein DFS21_11251 [Pseudomonas sp. 2848]|uniref:gp53-like domain-containing protein n=1 Tax=Pseudomonas sp. 2848 TaxID=2183926 RepID=UPI000DAF2248|nr:hypothetical protein [Pseudomonas sp. 2848]PZW75537.1 hypothetical protein DFS21_11251 [Pseudomonas sp. 2848]